MDQVQIQIFRLEHSESLVEGWFDVLWVVEGVPELGGNEDRFTWDVVRHGLESRAHCSFVVVYPCAVDMSVSGF